MPDSRVDTIIARVRPWSARSIAALVASHDLPDDEPFIAASDFRAAVREAAQPDFLVIGPERLREAAVIEAVAWSLFPDHPRPMSEAGLDCARRAVDAALAAADREAPNEPKETTT